jgi:hypothetical protein
VVVNRVHHDLLGDREPDDVMATVGKALRPELAARVSENFDDYHVLARRDDRNLKRLTEELPGRSLVVPHLDDDVHDVEGLLQMHRYLFVPGSERDQLLADVVA